MLSSLLMLVGLSASVGLGESAGVIGRAVVYGDNWQAQTVFDCSDKDYGGWRFQQTAEAVIGPGVIVGAEYVQT